MMIRMRMGMIMTMVMTTAVIKWDGDEEGNNDPG